MFRSLTGRTAPTRNFSQTWTPMSKYRFRHRTLQTQNKQNPRKLLLLRVRPKLGAAGKSVKRAGPDHRALSFFSLTNMLKTCSKRSRARTLRYFSSAQRRFFSGFLAGYFAQKITRFADRESVLLRLKRKHRTGIMRQGSGWFKIVSRLNSNQSQTLTIRLAPLAKT